MVTQVIYLYQPCAANQSNIRQPNILSTKHFFQPNIRHPSIYQPNISSTKHQPTFHQLSIPSTKHSINQTSHQPTFHQLIIPSTREGWLLSRFLNCSQDFGVALRVLESNVKIYPTFYKKSFKGLCLDICREKITNFSPTSLWRSYSFDYPNWKLLF